MDVIYVTACGSKRRLCGLSVIIAAFIAPFIAAF
jgi:hypothetical protein